jgi:hypothetical protein
MMIDHAHMYKLCIKHNLFNKINKYVNSENHWTYMNADL